MDSSNGCLQGGPDVTWCSTEHNIDSFFALEVVGFLRSSSALGALARSLASQTSQALLSRFWNADEKRFQQGYADSYPALDAQSWGTLYLLDNSTPIRLTRAETALAYVDATFRTSQKSYLSPQGINATGFGPYAPAWWPVEAVWSEGSYGMALAYERAGWLNESKATLSGLKPLVAGDGSVLYSAWDTQVS